MSLSETKIAELKISNNKRKLIFNSLVNKLQKTIEDFRKEEALNNLNEFLESLQEAKILIYHHLNEREIYITFLEPPTYLNKLKGKSGNLEIRQIDEKYNLYFHPDDCTHVRLHPEVYWSDFLEIFREYLVKCEFAILPDCESKNCYNCGEMLYNKLEPCGDSYCTDNYCIRIQCCPNC